MYESALVGGTSLERSSDIPAAETCSLSELHSVMASSNFSSVLYFHNQHLAGSRSRVLERGCRYGYTTSTWILLIHQNGSKAQHCSEVGFTVALCLKEQTQLGNSPAGKSCGAAGGCALSGRQIGRNKSIALLSAGVLSPQAQKTLAMHWQHLWLVASGRFGRARTQCHCRSAQGQGIFDQLLL